MSWLIFGLFVVDVTCLVDAFRDDKIQSVASEIKSNGGLSLTSFTRVSSAFFKLVSSDSLKTFVLMFF